MRACQSVVTADGSVGSRLSAVGSVEVRAIARQRQDEEAVVVVVGVDEHDEEGLSQPRKPGRRVRPES